MRYDQYGSAAMSDDFVDPRMIFRMLFGGGRFEDIFGDVSFGGIFRVLFLLSSLSSIYLLT